MKCKDCIYLSLNVHLSGYRNIIGYCIQSSHYGIYRYENDTCFDDAGVRKTSVKSNIQSK